MIDILSDNQTVRATVGGELSLDDYHQLEEALRHGFRFSGKINLIIDLRDMLSYSIDVAWEDLHFTRAYNEDFGRIAIITNSQWITWSALFFALFSHNDIRVFEDNASAEAWLQEAGGPAASGAQ
ncbi:MAG: STAS/SEC14 domain-containing protein [Betaproteobacteria bacterium]|nr:STAS/SEC14 domain-containing protein [Betaproteobacteria bacterium]